jgi:hypothetical protein
LDCSGRSNITEHQRIFARVNAHKQFRDKPEKIPVNDDPEMKDFLQTYRLYETDIQGYLLGLKEIFKCHDFRKLSERGSHISMRGRQMEATVL